MGGSSEAKHKKGNANLGTKQKNKLKIYKCHQIKCHTHKKPN